MGAEGAGIPDNHVIQASLDDADRFTAIFERHFDAIYSYAARRLGRELAEDVSAAVDALSGWLADHGATPSGAHWEVYFTDPIEIPDPAWMHFLTCH